MKLRRAFKIAAVVIAVPILLVLLVLLYLNFADLSGWKDTVARLASDAIGRELRIDGEDLLHEKAKIPRPASGRSNRARSSRARTQMALARRGPRSARR